MPENKSLWWHNPKFIIPTIFIPIIVAFIGLSPSLFPDNTSDKLSVSLSMSDPRRSGTWAIQHTINEDFFH